MNIIIDITYRAFALALLALVCFVLSASAQGLNPPPPGGYPNFNTAAGDYALFNLPPSNALYNTGVGYGSLYGNTSGSYNTAVGAGALYLNDSGGNNTAAGVGALICNIRGQYNTAFGAGALLENGGNNNTALGVLAGWNLDKGDNNIYIGNEGGCCDNNTIRIGGANSITGYGPQTATFIVAISGTAVVGDTVVVDGNGQLGTVASAARFKKEIKPMDKASEAVLALKPVTFHYKSDRTETPRFGLIAEEVAKVNQDLVVRDRNGEIYSVRYEAVNAMLLNEFLKEHKKVEELTKDFRTTIAQQQKQIDALTAGLQKVTAQLELSKAAPQTVFNNQ